MVVYVIEMYITKCMTYTPYYIEEFMKTQLKSSWLGGVQCRATDVAIRKHHLV